MANPNILTATSVLGKRQNNGPVATSIANLFDKCGEFQQGLQSFIYKGDQHRQLKRQHS